MWVVVLRMGSIKICSTCCSNFATNENINTTNNDIKIFPIPVVDKSYIEFPQFNKYKSLSIYDVTQKKIFESDLSNNTNYILDRNNFKSGLYFVTITDKENNTTIKKIVIE